MKEKELTLLIMAGGMGSRFGGLKQIEPIGPNGEFLIDYSVFDAIRAGFDRVVFVIKEENLGIFRETIGSRVEDKIKVDYAFQAMEDLPEGYKVPEGRVKPWGTAHAVRSARDIIKGPFAIINADDFYSFDAYKKVSEYLRENEEDYAVIGYRVINTLTSNGAVKRGVCDTEGEYLKGIIESNIEEKNGKIVASPLDGRDDFEINRDDYVSMNMIGFQSSIFDYIEEYFIPFLEENMSNLKSEYLIPDLLEKLTVSGKVRTKVIPTSGKWEGITYKEDLDDVVKNINKKIEDGEYPKDLWN